MYLGIVGLTPVVGMMFWLSVASWAQPARGLADEPTRKRVPLTQLVLFNTGVGYFQREGAVEGNARIDLSFPTTDINDLLKSLTVEDGGKPGIVSYDGAQPLEESLRAFALDLTGNPTFGQIINQARGAKVEVTLDVGTSPITGTIVGMEAQFETGNTEVHHLNVLASDGMRRLPLSRIGRLRFLDSTLEEEFRRALSVLGAGQNNARRGLSLHLQGEGNRNVKIAYVVETPIWKASYRLTLDGKKGKPGLQGWAIVQNSSEEDWKDVRLVLVSGRPISFQMDLAQPLFIPRPNVEPEVYASLRPPIFPSGIPSAVMPGTNLGAGGGALGGLGAFGGNFNQLGGGFGQFGVTPSRVAGNVHAMSPQVVTTGSLFNRYQIGNNFGHVPSRLSWEELLERRDETLKADQTARHKAGVLGSAIANNAEAIESLSLDADRIGEGFRYTVQPKLTLGRQKSAMVPVVDDALSMTRYSIYNRAVHPRFPLLGVKIKNTTDRHLQQGPIAVFDNGSYVGDSRLPDLGPGQERLLSYAMDLGVEVRPDKEESTQRVEKLKIVKGKVHLDTRWRKDMIYQVRNRSRQERLLLIEHPRTAEWEAVGKLTPTEVTRAFYRYEWKAAAGETWQRMVSEERLLKTTEALTEIPRERIVELSRLAQTSKEMKAALTKVVDDRTQLLNLEKERLSFAAILTQALTEQERIRLNLTKLPTTSTTYKRHLEKFDQLETEIEKVRKQIAEKSQSEKKLQTELDEYLKAITVS
jgi:hypothetical protein